MTPRRKADLLALGLLAAGILALLGDVVLRGKVLVDSDVLTYYFPVKTAIHNIFRSGESLLWNPYLGEGQPLAANPEHALFYPFTWLLFLMPVRWALAVSEVAHLALGFWGTRRLLRSLRLSEGACLLGASSWAFGGIFVSSIHFFPIFFAWTWVPWLAEVAVRPAFTRRDVVLGAIFGGLILLVGEPVSALMAAAIAATAFAASPGRRRRLPGFAAMGLLALGLAAVCWIPGAALARQGPRAEGIPPEWSDIRSFPPVRLVELAIPRACGDISRIDDRNYFGWRLYPARMWPFYWGIYAGALFVPLVLAGFTKRHRRFLVFGASALLAFLIALGPPGLLWTAARRLAPPLRGIRYPEKFLAMTFFCLIPPAAAGFDRLRRSSRARGLAAGFLAAAAALALVASRSGWGGRVLPWDDRTAISGILSDGTARLLYGALIVALLGLLARRRRPARRGWSVCLIALAAEVLLSSRSLIHTRDADWMERPPPVVRRLLAVRPVPRLVDHMPPWPDVALSGLHQPGGDFDRNRILYMQPVQWGIPLALELDFDVTYIASTDRAHELMVEWGLKDARVFSRLLAGRGIGAVLTWNHPFSIADPVGLLAVPLRRPEVDSELTIRRFQGNAGFFQVTAQDPDSLPRAGLVEGDAFPDIGPAPAPAEISDLSSRGAALDFRTRSPGASLIRIARTNDGHWRALLDGKPWPVGTLDVSLIGLQVPAGVHDVRLRYRDRTLFLGVGVTLASMMFLILAFVTGARPREE